MKTAKKTAEYTIYQRKDGRYAVKNADKQWVHGDEKTAILNKEGLIKAPAPKPSQQEAEEAATNAEAEKAEEEGKVTGE
jgi:hypothetical protein